MRASVLRDPGRFVPALAVVVIAIVLAGCGAVSRAARASSLESPPSLATIAAVPAPAPLDGAPVAPSSAAPAGESPISAAPTEDIESRLIGSSCSTNDICAVEPGEVAILHAPPSAETSGVATVAVAGDPDEGGAAFVSQQQKKAGEEEDEYDIEEYDPWEPFNEAMFEFNLRLDRWILKPVAKGYDRVVPDEIQRMIANAFDNLGSIKRMVNSLLQGKWQGAMNEWGRFMLNTTIGIGGLFDIARHQGIEKSREDFGQTLGVYGAGPGPYLILPFQEPMTVRDGIGRAIDTFLDPLGYLVSLSIIERLALEATETVNDRSLNLELFQGFEEAVIDFYSAVRHGYLERRRNLIKE